jgi:hypothetical protein
LLPTLAAAAGAGAGEEEEGRVDDVRPSYPSPWKWKHTQRKLPSTFCLSLLMKTRGGKRREKERNSYEKSREIRNSYEKIE